MPLYSVDISSKRLLERENPEYDEWRSRTLSPWQKNKPASGNFENSSGISIKEVYSGSDLPDGYEKKYLGMPGEYPFTRGVYPDMYRGRKWTMRMFSGFGTPEDTNKRLKYLIKHGESGLSIAFDMPTLYGYDCDSQRAEGEVGKCGVNVTSLKDMEVIFKGIDLGSVSTSMTINAPAAVLTAMYIAVAKKQGVPMSKLSGTV